MTRSPAKRHRRLPKLLPTPVLYVLRLVILGVAIGTLVGTVLAGIKPEIRPFASSSSNPSATVSKSSQPTPTAKEITPLKVKINALVAKQPQLQVGILVVDLDNNAYVDLNSLQPKSSASLIKFPILVASLQEVDSKKIRLDEMLRIDKSLIAGGSGNVQKNGVGNKITVLEALTKMITISDNTATNMLIFRLGGKDNLNKKFVQWGLTSTVIKNNLPDFQGTNTTSPRDLVHLLRQINGGQLLSLKSRDRAFYIMENVTNDNLLAKGLGSGAIITHKTGEIATAIGDTGLVDIPNGKRYAIAIMVQRPANQAIASVIQDLSRIIYQHLESYDRPSSQLPKPEEVAHP